MTQAQVILRASEVGGALFALLMLGVTYRWWLRLFGSVLVPDNMVGIVRKKFVLYGPNRTLPDGAIVALKGEAGLQADTLAPGVHWGLWPWQYAIDLQPFIAIKPGKLGVVSARDGKVPSNGRVLGKRVDCDSFQSARAFITNAGERGPQLVILPPGAYRINTALFTIAEAEALEIADNMVGVVTTKEGKPLDTGTIAGPEVPGHSMYQDAQGFVDAGGCKGLQEQVMLAGRYFINPMFATVELKPMTDVPIANVGVVIAYVGKAGKDVSGDAFKHGNLVARGERGVWVDPLDPGKYPINPFTHRVELVPTANVVLNWATGKSEAHNLDKNLSTITVRSSDGFTFNLDVSQIIHIPRADAPKVIARFGNMVNLVTQVLEPTIGNYFRNAAQNSDAIDFLKSRQQRQAEARDSIQAALKDYDVGAVDTLIGDITPPEALMKTLTDRKIASQQQTTFETQKLAQETRKSLEEATAMADTQASVVSAQRSVQIADYAAQSTVKRATGEADAKRVNADADAHVTRTTGSADAEKTRAVGTAEADVIKLKIGSMQSENYATVEVARALAASGMKLVPDVVAGGDSGGSLVNVLLARTLLNGHATPPAPVEKP